MQQGTSFLKRFIALALALVLLVSNANLGVALQAFAATPAEKTVGQIIVENYDELTENEAHLLEHGYIVGTEAVVNYSIPDDSDNLIAVDTDNKKISVTTPTDWTAVKVEIVVGTDVKETVTLNAAGEGVYTYDGNAFSVKAYYSLSKAIAGQEEIFANINSLKTDLANVDAVDSVINTQLEDGQMPLDVVTEAMPVMEMLAEGIDLGFMNVQFGAEAAAAVGVLESQVDDVKALNAAYKASASKVQHTLEKAAEYKAVIADLHASMVAIQNDEYTKNSILQSYLESEDAELAAVWKTFTDNLDDLVKGLGGLCGTNDWTVVGKNIVNSGVDFIELDSLIYDLPEDLTAVSDDKAMLIDEADVQFNLSMFNVRVSVELEICKNNGLTQHGEEILWLTLHEGATKAEILEAVEDSGIVDTALSNWSGYYVAGKFDTTYTDLPETLTEDIAYRIIYTPKQFTVTTDYDGITAQYYFGYKLTLPNHEDPAQAYDYTVNGVKMAQGDVVTIEDDTTITRKVGKAYYSTDLYTVAANCFGGDIAKAILTSGALKGNVTINVRRPDPTDADSLLVLENDKLTAVATYPSSYEGLNWVPYTYGENGTENYFNGTEASWTGDSAYVQYILKLTNLDAKVAEALALSVTLKNEADAQVATLDRLNAQYDTMGMLDKTKLGALNGVIDTTDFTPDDGTEEDARNLELRAYFKNTVSAIMKNNLGTGNKLKIYNMLTEYNNDGLKYYYENSAAVIAEINDLASYLGDMIKEQEALKIMVSAAGYPEYAEKIANLETLLAEVLADLTAPNAAIDLDSSNLGKLIAALTSKGKVENKPAGTAYLVSLNLPVQDSSLKMIQVIVEINGESKTFSKMELLVGTEIEKEIVDELKKQINDFVGDVTHYDLTVEGDDLDSLVGKTIDENINIYYTYTVKEYTVKISGEEDQTVSLNDLEINLPKHPTEGYRYEYTVDGVSGITSSTYTFTVDQLTKLFKSGTYNITRVEINEAEETFNETFGDWIVRDANGNVTGLYAKVDGNKDGIMGFAMTIVNSGYTYIGLNDEALLYMNAEDTLEIKLQTLINALLSDKDFSNETLITLGKDGKGVFVRAKMDIGNTEGVESKARAGGVKYLYKDLDFTLYLSSVPSQMATVAKGLEAVKDYMTFNAGNGVMNINLNLPEKIYEVYLTALLATGNVDKTDMNAINSEIAFQFLWDYVESIINSEATTTTFTNTLAKAGISRDLTGAEEYYQLLKKALTNDGVVINPVDDSDEVDVSITAKSQKAINSLIKMVGFDISAYETYLGMIYEYKYDDAEINVAAKATLGNTNKDFQAAVIDFEQLKASGVKEKAKGFDYAANAAERINAIKGEAVVILLADLPAGSDLTINGTTILDLNGKTINGNITVKSGTLYIIDSTLNTEGAGKVTGKISGAAKIFAGVYSQDVTSFLPEGYEQLDSNAVANRLYTLETEGEDTTVAISTDLLRNRDVDYFDFVKALAIDLGVDLVLNSYTSAALAFEGSELYNINFNDLIALLESSTKKADLVQKVIDSVNIGNFDDFINTIIADMLDFVAIKAAAEKNEDLVEYAMYTHPFGVDVIHNTAKDYIDFGISANEKITKNFSISLKAALEADRDYIAKIADALDAVVNEAAITVQIDEIENKYIEAKGIEIPVIDGGADIRIIMDLTVEDGKYAAAIAEAFGKTYSNALKPTVDAATAGKIIDKLETYVDGNNKIEKGITYVLNTLTKVLKKLGVEDKPFGDFETEFGKYVLKADKVVDSAFRGVFENLDLNVYIEIKLFDENTVVECEHEWGEWVTTTPETCTTDGVLTRTCKKCGETETQVAPATGHTEVTVPGTPADCVNDGLTDGVNCSVCGCVIVPQEVIPALDHDWVSNEDGYDPTCSEPGMTDSHTCSRCEEVMPGEEIPATGDHVDLDPKDHACDYCGTTMSECYDNDGDHYCDWCGAVMGDHEDNDKDHFCDVCGERMSWCRDCDRDHFCDWCGERMTDCVDRNHNHICDICWKVLSECEDKNHDHLCDYCLRIMTWCYDLNKDHKCDWCGREISKCIDTDRDGICDICGADLEWVIRLWGENRAETARDAAEELKAILGVEKFDNIVYASGYNFPDALTGTYFANVMEAPILMYFHQEIAMNLKYIQENLAKDGTVYILGGTEAVPASIEIQLVEAGINVVRLGGETRFETNLEILEATGFDGGETVLVCTGYEFADSLSASATGLPILLVNNSFTELRESQVEYLENLDAECNYILIGGTNAISAELEAVIAEYDVDGKVVRIGGATRFETSLMVAEKFFPKADQAILAYGWMFPDALCGGTIGYALGAPVILTSDVKIDLAADYIEDRDINSGYVMGGTVRLSDEVVCIAFDLESPEHIHLR